jgi:hypothetical protein
MSTTTIDPLAGYVLEKDLAALPGMPCQRTLRRYRQEPDGPAYLEFAGKIWIDLRDFRERFLASRRRAPNPRRGRR